MNLTNELQNLRKQLRDQHPEEVKTIMDKTTNDLIASNIAEKGIKLGEQMPNFCLPNAVGNTIELKSLLQKNVVIISLYRGGWCPYCNLELRKLQQYLPKFQSYGATLVAISPETPDNSLSTQEKNELTFEVLSDVGNQFAKKLGLVFILPETLRPIYQNFGIDIPSYNGDESFELPIPATYVINQKGQVVLASINADYTKRLDPESILVTLQNL
ncbi:MAG: peroxiredoxin-like family protein [Crocosphaera sp.]|nr:peroxiredoxin-like family protein [Crocosphaera sp.]